MEDLGILPSEVESEEPPDRAHDFGERIGRKQRMHANILCYYHQFRVPYISSLISMGISSRLRFVSPFRSCIALSGLSPRSPSCSPNLWALRLERRKRACLPYLALTLSTVSNSFCHST